VSDTSTLGLILGFLGVCVTQAVSWRAVRVQANRTEDKLDQVGHNADTAATEAATAAKRAEPVSNGFARKVLDSLEILESGQRDHGAELAEIRSKLDRHIGDHASADVLRKDGR
jgi:hypothetical protein